MHRPGMQTSEFWLTIVTLALAVANAMDYVHIPWEHFQWLVMLTAVYVASRSFVKGRLGL